MIYLNLFLTFLKIGAVSFGGGYGMISLVREQVISNGWLTEEGFTNMIAVSESTPGPIAINMATFVGSSQGGLLGSFLATLGVVLPSFVIILLIASLINGLLKFKGVQGFLYGVKPCVVALILATSVIMGMKSLLNLKAISDGASVDIYAVIILAILLCIHFAYKKLRKKKPSPILMILISAFFGIIFYS